MQFWLRSALVIAMTGVVAGCVSPEDRVINEDHQYVNAVERGEVRLPEGAIRPTGDDAFKLPQERPSGDIGEALNIQSPLQLLALASGSRLDDKNKVSKIWFDKTAVIEDLPKFTFDALQSYLKSNKVVDSNIDEQKKSVQTGWITDVREGSFWSWGDDSSSTSYKFLTAQQDRANGFVTIVNVKLTGHQRNGKDVPLSTMTKNEVNRAETTFLNDYIYHYQLVQEVLMKKASIARKSDFTLTVGANEQGQQVFHSAKAIDTVWVHFRTLVESLGFTVDDFDRSGKKLFVTYVEQEQGFWDSIWGDDVVQLSLPPAQYVLKVTTKDKQSAVTFYDENEQPLSGAQIQSMEAAFITAAKKLGLEL